MLHSSGSAEVQSLSEAEDEFMIFNIGSWQPVRVGGVSGMCKNEHGFKDRNKLSLGHKVD